MIENRFFRPLKPACSKAVKSANQRRGLAMSFYTKENRSVTGIKI